jgi:hypothetical protein
MIYTQDFCERFQINKKELWQKNSFYTVHWVMASNI